MTEQTTSDNSLADMSLADYRASREGHAEAQAAEKPEPKEAPAGAQDDALGESAAEQEGAADDSSEESQEKRPAKKGGWQRKIERLNAENEQLKQQLASRPSGDAGQQREEVATVHEATTQVSGFNKPKPKLEDFNSIEEHADALVDWKLDKRDFEQAQAAAQARAQAETQTILDGWNSRKAEFVKEHSDYDERMEEVDDIKLTPAHQRILLESEHGPELAYQLAEDRELLERIAAMHPIAAAKEIGKLEAALSAPPEKTTQVSAAPRPIRPVGSRSAAHAGVVDLSKMSLADYRRARDSGRI